MVYLENEFIKVAFSAKGAEIQQILNLKTDENYLWKGDSNFWGKFSPVLFPIVGGLKNNTYIYKDHSYTMNRHGFARDMLFTLESQSAVELLFVLSDTPDTLEVFPFKFKLGIRYKIANSTLSCSYEVFNPDKNDLLFSIGGHPAFAVNTSSGIEYSDYFLKFDNDDVIEYHQIDEDLISSKTHKIHLDDGKLSLSHELFYNDALVFKTLESEQISLGNTKNDDTVEFKFSNFPYFGIWAAKDANFVCLEPWCGIADVVGHDQSFENKEGIIKLGSHEEFTRTWSVLIR